MSAKRRAKTRPERRPTPRMVPPRIRIEDVHLSAHASQRILEMAVEGEEVRDAIERPADGWWSDKHGAWTLRRGRVAVGIAQSRYDNGKPWVVLTVVWSSDGRWVADYERGNMPAGRAPRAVRA